jgi:hypothetical protein
MTHEQKKIKLDNIKSKIMAFSEMHDLANEKEANDFHDKGSRQSEVSTGYLKSGWDHYNTAISEIENLIKQVERDTQRETAEEAIKSLKVRSLSEVDSKHTDEFKAGYRMARNDLQESKGIYLKNLSEEKESE